MVELKQADILRFGEEETAQEYVFEMPPILEIKNRNSSTSFSKPPQSSSTNSTCSSIITNKKPSVKKNFF